MTYADPVNMTGFKDIFIYANSVTSDVFGVGFLFSLCLIIIMYLNLSRQVDFSSSCVVGLFISSLVSVLLFFMDVVQDKVMFICILVFVVSLIFAFTVRNRSAY